MKPLFEVLLIAGCILILGYIEKHFDWFGILVIFIMGGALYDLIVRRKQQYAPSGEKELNTDSQCPQNDLPPDSASSKIIIDCPKCSQKLRIPSGRQLRVTCPICTQLFEM